MAKKPEPTPDIDHDQAPTSGGSYLRQADGTLVQTERTKTREEHAEEEAAKKAAADTAAPAAQIPQE